MHDGLTVRMYNRAPGTWTLWACGACGCGYLNPRPTLQSIGLAYDEYYTHLTSAVDEMGPQSPRARARRSLRNGYYNLRFGYALKPASALGFAILNLMPVAKAVADRWVRHLRLPHAGARLLEVGCGNGAFLKVAQSCGWDVVGLDTDAIAVEMANRSGLCVHAGVLEETTFPQQHFDAITLTHVIEHLHDPQRSLEICYKMLRPGGVLTVATPNLHSTGHRVFGRNWVHLDPPRHLVLFTPQSLRDTLKRAGFQKIKACRTADLCLFSFWFSDAIARGDSTIGPPPPSRRLRLRIKRAEWRGVLQPAHSEEVFMLARKPLKQVQSK